MVFYSTPNGNSPVLAGAGSPSSTLGNVGDLYIDTTAKTLYGPKTSLGWGTGTSLKGNQGDTGPTGATGPAGGVASVNGSTGAVVVSASSIGAASTSHASTHASSGSDPVIIDLDTNFSGNFEGENINFDGVVFREIFQYIDAAYNTRASDVHGHGAITTDGKIGTTANRLVGTGTGGTLGTVTLGTGLTLSGGVLSGASTYTLPSATTTALGGVVVGAGLSVTGGTVSANVTSVAGRTGAITIASSDVSGLAAVATSGSASDLGTGTLPAARLPATSVTASLYGGGGAKTTAFSVGADGRLTFASSTDIAIAGSQITSGTVGSARLGSGTANSTTYLRGDQSWATIAAEVIEYATTSAFPGTGSSAKVYFATDASRAYRWTGSEYVEVGASQGYTTAHTHTASDITSGTLSGSLLPFATAAQAQDLTATTVAVNPANVRTALTNWLRIGYRGTYSINGGNATNESPTYASLSTSSSVANSAASVYNDRSVWQSNTNATCVDWTKPVTIYGRMVRQAMPANGVFRYLLGSLASAGNAYETLTGRGIGIELRQSRIWLLAHNGTSLTSLDTGIDGSTIDWNGDLLEIVVRSDGSGNVSLTASLNGGSASTASTTGGPTTRGGTTQSYAGITNGASTTQAWMMFTPHQMSVS